MKKKILVFGSFVVDLTGRSATLPTPGQTILGSSFKLGAGGKGSNQAVAAHRAGADVTLVTKIGQDVFGDVAMNFYKAEGMNTDSILIDPSKETGVALILVNENTAQNEIVVIPAACANITEADVEKIKPLIESADIVLAQLETNADALYRVIDIAYAAGAKIVLNPAPAAPIPDDVLSKIDVITPNETEAEALTGVSVTNLEEARNAAKIFLGKGVKNVVLTLGALGAYATDGEKDELLDRIAVNAVDTTGAGDAFNGGFCMALAEDKDLFEALRYGNVTGALSVTQLGTAPAMPRREAIDQLYGQVYGGK